MVSFRQRLSIQVIPYKRPSYIEEFFWHEEEIATFRRDYQLEQYTEAYLIANETEKPQPTIHSHEYPESLNAQELQGNSQQSFACIGYDRPDAWMGMQPKNGTGGQADFWLGNRRQVKEITHRRSHCDEHVDRRPKNTLKDLDYPPKQPVRRPSGLGRSRSDETAENPRSKYIGYGRPDGWLGQPPKKGAKKSYRIKRVYDAPTASI